ncbi:Uncharacterised protein [uncultured archaeon]|nr:Uncharacterised protein [uncultured archaeon]
MNTQKMVGYIVYAIGIIGGVEGATTNRAPVLTSVVSLVIIVVGAYLLEK